ncbi:MAG: YlbF family regulator [Ruminiclostridium sp.]|nr:YlbF family regulator [Ruminiclostridium sp.]
MDIIIRARELGEAIANSKEMKRLKASDANLQTDTGAASLMKEYKQLQIELVRASKGKKDAKIIDEIKEMLIKKQQELYEYEITNEYLEAKSEFDKFMKNINDVISYAITGEVQCSSGGCGSCSGCK